MYKKLLKCFYYDERSLDSIMTKFPVPYSFAFSYDPPPSSLSPKTKEHILHIMFAVDDPLAFHQENLKYNSDHYSFLKYGGKELVSAIQERGGAKIYFNSGVKVYDTLINYGVISTHNLIDDLSDWETLYVSRLLHRPVGVIRKPTSKDLLSALNNNLRNALHGALLCLPESFSEENLYDKIVNLPYSGGNKNYFEDDDGEIEKIIRKVHFRRLYESHIKMMPHLYWNDRDGTFEQDCKNEAILFHLNSLPKQVQDNMCMEASKSGLSKDHENMFKGIASVSGYSFIVKSSMENIMGWPYITQGLKNLFTSGKIIR